MLSGIINIRFSNPAYNITTKKRPAVNSDYQKSSYNFATSSACFNPISFTSQMHRQTPEVKYFKLPDGASPDIFQKVSAMNILNNNDVIVTAPTGTGKTAIAHYVISQNMENGAKTFYTTPLKALSNEKFKSFQKIYGKENVGLLTGDTKLNATAPILVMTTEVYRNMVLADKFNNKNSLLNNLKTVIFDELHYLGDVDRGNVWEQSIILSNPKTQFLSLSATIGNNKEIANWMANSKNHKKAEIVSPKNRNLEMYRPQADSPIHTVLVDVPPENRHVPLDFEIIETYKGKNPSSQQSNGINKGKHKKHQNISKKYPAPDFADYQNLVHKLKKEDKIPALFFVFSKRQSNNILNHLSRYGDKLNTAEEQDEITDIINKYKKDGKYLGESLNYNALYKGYAIHNAGLLPAQKELIEELFNKKLVKVVIATETLSAGINMPAKTTVITSDRTPRGELNANKFHQMAGRAGRRGIDTRGYCISLAVTPKQSENFATLIKSAPNDLKSAFRPDFSFVAGYYATFKDDKLINELLEKSFYVYDNNPQVMTKKSKELKSIFSNKRTVLKKMNFIKSNHALTPKGELLAKLNGYEQIPIINAIYGKKLMDLTPAELASAVGVMANIQPKMNNLNEKNHNQNTIYSHSNHNVTDFVRSFNSILMNFNKEIKEFDSDYKETAIDANVANHLYEWASLNSESKNSVENWKYLYNGNIGKSVKNEGSLFREITTTADLLKQIKIIAEKGMEISTDNYDYEYYRKLYSNTDKALGLICRTPVDSDTVC